MVRIDVPIEVYEELKRHARPFEDTSPADVIRRLLEMNSETGGTHGPTGSGYLLPLIRHGLVTPGEGLVLERPRLGEQYLARVTESGEVELSDGRIFVSPSGAANACLGGSNNGWTKWRRADDGRTLDDLRSEMRKNKKK